MIEKDISKRWEQGLEHHPESLKVEDIIKAGDIYGCYSWGGDGDNGEEILYYLDIYFELKDAGEIE